MDLEHKKESLGHKIMHPGHHEQHKDGTDAKTTESADGKSHEEGKEHHKKESLLHKWEDYVCRSFSSF